MATSAAGRGAAMAGPTLIQRAAMLFGVIFLVVGVVGFIPGLTTDYDRLGTFGDEGAKLLGIFGGNWIENIVHLAYGVGGLMLAKTWKGAKQYFVLGGVVYLVVAALGIVTGVHHDANLLAINGASNVLHVVLGVAMVGIGLVLGKDEVVVADR